MQFPSYGDAIVILALVALLFGLLYGVIILSKRWTIMMQERIMAALKRRRNAIDDFRVVNGYSWDCVMVFKVYGDSEECSHHQIRNNMKYVLGQLAAGGLEIRLFYSLQRKEVYCKVRAPLHRLMKEADRINYKMALDPLGLRNVCEAGREGLWPPLTIPDVSVQTTLAPYDYIYARYEFDSESNSTRPDLATVYKQYASQVLHCPPTPSSTPTAAVVRSPLMIGEDSGHDESGSSKKLDEETPDSQMCLFRGVDRIKLIHSIITCPSVGGCNLDIAKMVKKDCIKAFFPLHDMVELRTLEAKWLRFLQPPWKQHVDDVKDYFGEKIGLYFVFLGYYTTWLIVPAVLGVLCWLWIAVENNNPDAPTVPYFAGFMALWSSLFLEFWKRTEKTNAMKWGMVGFESEEQTRPQFQGALARSPVNGKPYLFFSRMVRIQRSMMSNLAIMGFILVVICVIACIFAIRVIMQLSNFTVGGVAVASTFGSFMLAIQIQVMNSIYSVLALKLNNHENHRTDTEYEDSLIAKTFLFQFVNSFASLFYISFIKPFMQTIDPCLQDNCMVELQSTLGTIFLTRLAVGSLVELGVPLVTSLIATHSRAAGGQSAVEGSVSGSGTGTSGSSKKSGAYDGLSGNTTDLAVSVSPDEHKTDMSEVEKAFAMAEYDVMLGTFDDYSQIVMQFGYTTMFIAAFPLATVMSFVSNYVAIRVDAWKLCQLCRRPEPRSCEDIGTWYTILEIVSLAAVFINSGLVAFTGNYQTINDTWCIRVWIFILMATGLFSIRVLVAYAVPDEPPETTIQLERQEYINGKIIDNIDDENDDGAVKDVGLVPAFTVVITDDDPL